MLHTVRLLSLSLFPSLAAAQDEHEHEHETSHGHPPSFELHDPGDTPLFISVAIDSLFELVDGPLDDGSELNLRALEMTAHAQIDPLTLGYVVLVADEEEIQLEEAALVRALDDDVGLRAGRFFIDFGRHMSLHEHELPFPERPRALRAFLGREVAGTGLRGEGDWHTDGALWHASLGVFDNLIPTHAHGEQELPGEPLAVDPGRANADDLGWTGRVAWVGEGGDHGRFHTGISLADPGAFELELHESGARLRDLDRLVLGVDAGYEAADGSWSVGGELLVSDGDVGAVVNDAGTPADLTDDTLTQLSDELLGGYVWLERHLDERDSVGFVYSVSERAEPGEPTDAEATLFYSRAVSDGLRLRVGIAHLDAQRGGDETRLLFQLTGWFGHHPHESH